MRRRKSHDLVRSLRKKFVMSAMVAVACVLAAIVAALDLVSYHNLVSRADTQLEAIAQSGGGFDALVQDSKRPPAREGGGPAPQSMGFSAETPYEMRFFSVTLTADGQVISSDTDRVVSLTDDEAQALAQEVVGTTPTSTSGFKGVYRYSVTEQQDGTYLAAFLDCNRDLASFRSLMLAGIVVALVAWLAVFLLVVVLSRRAVAPVEDAYMRQRRFITDASHDLKTPLSVIGSSVDVIEIESGSSEWTHAIHEQVDRMSDLVSKLVMLSRMDEGDAALSLDTCNVDELLGGIALDFSPKARAADLAIELLGEKNLQVEADPALLYQALSLLMDNALTYAPAHTTVTLARAAASHARVKIQVANDAPQLGEGAHPELFERFYRADASRTSTDEEGARQGHGIGLAVVRSIAEAHGGTVDAHVSDGVLTITLTL
ncbi:MAG: sensor histidine kinase [Atopobiaceae bacterium]|jgi:two-component system sensor histidine kinase CiaH